MNSRGILLFGYDREQAGIIQEAFAGIAGTDLTLISASGKEEWTIIDILETQSNDRFEERADKICMFLGFSKEQIQAALKEFPKKEGLPRPLFCVLTEHNLRWRFDTLREHLREEHLRMTGETR